MQLKLQCRDFILTVAAKLLHKAPVMYRLVRALECLDPRHMAREKDRSVAKMKKVLQFLSEANRIEGDLSACEDILRQYHLFVSTTVAEHHQDYADFNPDKSRVDELLATDMGRDPSFRLVWTKVVKKIWLLSHSQASVKRGFSVNKEIAVENLKEESFVAQRYIYDHIVSVGGILKVDLNKQLLLSASAARQRYAQYLEEQKREREETARGRKRKAVLDDINESKEKKKRLGSEITELLKSADELAEKAEQTGKLVNLTKSNSLRRTAKQKQEELVCVETELDKKIEALKE